MRNKKRVGYTYELTLKFKGTVYIYCKVSFIYLLDNALLLSLIFFWINSWIMESGEWLFRGEKKKIKGHLDIHEVSFGELDDLQVCAKMLFGC